MRLQQTALLKMYWTSHVISLVRRDRVTVLMSLWNKTQMFCILISFRLLLDFVQAASP